MADVEELEKGERGAGASRTEEALIVEQQNALLRSYLETDREARWLTELRLQALDRFSHMAWPSPEEEEWRRTDLTEIELLRYWPIEAGKLRCGGNPLSPFRKARRRQEAGILALPLLEAARNHGRLLRPILEQGLQKLDNRIQAWHYGLLTHGLYLRIPAYTEISEPLVFDLRERGAQRVSAPHVVIVVEEGARATVVLRTGGPATGELLLNAGIDLRLADAAALNLVHIQQINTESLYFAHGSAVLGRDSRLHSCEIILGGRLAKTRLECELRGPGAEALLDGAYFAGGSQHMDIRTVQRHFTPRANSRALYKGAVKDSGRTIFQGLIEVRPEAAKTDAYLTNRNLILNDGARADSIPALRIDTNDVRCSHGSTTGRIDEEQLFYLTSRGVAPEQARRMLILGFFEELVERLPGSVQEEVRARIEQRLDAGLGAEKGRIADPR